MNKLNSVAMLSVLLLAIVVSTSIFAIPVEAKPNNDNGINNPNKLWGAPSYVLNILGKKADWKGDPSYESTDRHTMFVPEDVEEFLELHPEYKEPPEGTGKGLRIWVKQDADFAVEDPNMFDDGQCNLTMASGKYEVYFVALGKPGREAHLEGWIYNVTADEYLLKIGEVKVRHGTGKEGKGGGKPNWQDAHDMLYVDWSEVEGILTALGVSWAELLAALGYQPTATEVWVFDFINWLAAQTGYEYAYLWKLVSGCKHIQVRFYKV